MRLPCLVLSSALGLLACVPCRAQTAANAAPPGALCQAAIGDAQRAARLPRGLLGAIGLVESGRPDLQTGVVRPWPWTIDAEGRSAFFQTEAEAVEAVRALQARGIASIDVGCMQINLFHHPHAFASLEEAFDPARNASYAARFLLQLFGQTHDWANAAALYHSTTADLAEAYGRKVLTAWGVSLPPRLASAAFPRSSNAGGPPAGPVAVMLPASPGQDIRVMALPYARAASGSGSDYPPPSHPAAAFGR